MKFGPSRYYPSRRYDYLPCRPSPFRERGKLDHTKDYKICFFGPSGSGKTTAFKFAQEWFHKEKNLYACQVDVASVLREIQVDVHKHLKLPSSGSFLFPETFPQDAKLMEFLAENYESAMLEVFRTSCNSARLHALIQNRNYVIINTDCRNNAYQVLKELSFIFIKVETEESLRTERLATRKDFSKSSESSVNCCDQIRENFVLSNNGTLEDFKGAVYNTLNLLKLG